MGVLPLKDLSPGQDRGHLCEGLAEEILLGLNRIEGLRVLSRTTSFPYADIGLSPTDIGRRLGVSQVLAGALGESEGRLILQGELLETAAGTILWSGRLEAGLHDLGVLIDGAIQQVAQALQLRPPAPHRLPLVPEAYDLALRARQHYFRYNRSSMHSARQLYREALAVDPGYALAWAGLANCAAYLFTYVDRSEAFREQAEEASRRALELDPTLAEAHASRGVALSADQRSEEADEAFETALRLDPNLYEAAYFYARHCFAGGRMEEAVTFFEWAAALRPEDYQAVLLVAQAYDKLGVKDEAERARRQGLILAENRLQRVPGDVRARYLGANALVGLGERERGLAWARQAREMDPDDSMLLYNLGCIHALAGNPGEALDCLRRAVKMGLTQVTWFLNDGDLDPLRKLPAFQALLLSLAGR